MKDPLKYLICVGIYGVLIVPFIVANSMFFPFITGKAFTFRIIVEIIFGLWFILIMKDKEFRPKWSWLLSSGCLLVFIMFLADINAVAPFKAFWSNYERMEGWVTLVHLLAYLLVLSSMLRTGKMWEWFLRSSVVVSVIMGGMAYSEMINTGADRVSGPLGNPIYISHYFLFNFFFVILLIYKDILFKLETWKDLKKIFTNLLLYIYLVPGIFSIYFVYKTSRGVLLGLIGGLLITMVFLAIYEKRRVALKQLALGGILAIFILVGGFIALRNTNFVKNNSTLARLAEISWSNINGQARQLIWPMAMKGFEEKPLLGWGQEGFNYVFNKYYDARMYAQEQWFDRAHNTSLDYLISGGILGLLSYLSLYIAALYLLWFRKNNLDIAEKGLITGLLAGYYFQSMFVFDNLVSYMFFFITLSYIHSRSVEGTDEIEAPARKGYISIFVQNEEYQNYILIPLVIVLITVCVWQINIPALNANITLIQAFRLVQAGRVVDGLQNFKLALSYHSLGDSEIREQLLSYTPSILSKSEIDQQIKKDFFALTVDETEKQISRVPDDARYYILMGSFLNNVGFYEQALPYIKKAIELSPQKQTMRFELIRALFLLGENKLAMVEAKGAYELDKNYNQAKLIYIETVKNEIKADALYRAEGEQILKDLEAN